MGWKRDLAVWSVGLGISNHADRRDVKKARKAKSLGKGRPPLGLTQTVPMMGESMMTLRIACSTIINVLNMIRSTYGKSR